ncbi:hypothetical protein ABPG74_017990 [Tetrahymena malaccensis]
MGWITNLLIITLPGTAYATFISFRLGNQLPIACRNFGRQIGMGYNYFKVILKLLAPQNEKPAEIVDIMRKTEQQSIALTREITESILRAKQDLKNSLPPELQNNPMNLIRIQQDKPLQNPTENVTGAKLLDVTFKERKRIIERKKDLKQKSTFQNIV